MYLKSLTLKGFKSFPEKTRLDFGSGVSVVVGPNGSGKSNVTDAVLWAMGEQSPLAIRGQSMQDVIFAGGRGAQARSAAEVEIVLDNSDGTIDLPLGEISIVRRLDRTGDGGYQLNGARCRLADVTEVLSDTGLGKEAHSVISQGRVEEIVSSKPRDRRLLIEEAAGLGKHRKRRRRAQLKLEHTQDNLDRALDVEREARTRLRPLKRQAEAAELHERLERQLLEARWQLVKDQLRSRRAELTGAETRVSSARERRGEVESRLQTVVARRSAAESALTERSERHDALSARMYAARSSRDRVALRGEQVLTAAELLVRRIERVEAQLGRLQKLADEHEQATSSPEGERGSAPDSSDRAGAGDDDGPLARAWEDLRAAIAEGVERAHAESDPRDRARVVAEVVTEVQRLSEVAVALAVEQAQVQPARERVSKADLATARALGVAEQRLARARLLRERLSVDLALLTSARRLAAVLGQVGAAIESAVVDGVQAELARDSAAGEQVAGELRACAQEEAEIQSELRGASDVVTEEEVAAQRLRDQAADAQESLDQIEQRLGVSGDGEGDGEEADVALSDEETASLEARAARVARRREQLGPVNPLAQEEYAQALAHVEELERRREDLETALRELRGVIRDTDRQIRETFEQTFQAAAENFAELAGELFPGGGSGRLRLVSEERAPRSVLGGESLSPDADAHADDPPEDEEAEGPGEEPLMGVEIEITPAGKSTKRLSLLSGGEKSMTALAFLFAVFLARPCPFYILDEVEAALDDLNLDRFLALLRRYSDRAQFIVITHQKRTMEAADWLYGVSMAQDGVSKVISRRLPAGAHGAGGSASGEPGDIAEVA